MSNFIINGGKKLKGEISVNGAKNAALKIIPAVILSKKPCKITNLPLIEDVSNALKLIKMLGAKVKHEGNVATIDPGEIHKSELPLNTAGKFRTSVMFAGPLLARFGEAILPMPGGCNLASGAKRPINLFIDGFSSLGAEINETESGYILKAKKLIGTNFFFPVVSVTATESLMMTAVLAEGTTTLRNSAMEPEIPALAEYLNSVGAKIKGAGTPTIIIEGVKNIAGGTYAIIPDRIETGSFAIMAAATRSEITITNCNPLHVFILLKIFKEIGINYQHGDNWLKIIPAKDIKSYNIKTHEYPGFPTDLQSPYTILMTQATGQSLIHETIYDRRLLYVDMLMQMGANIIMCDPHRVVVTGPSPLFGKKLISPDIRAGIAMVIAGLLAEGQTTIENIYQIERGYENIDGRLKALGADIKRLEE